MKKLVSIIIPIYNVDKYLHRCINSVIKQSYENLEIILVNDGSSDNSSKICDDYAIQDSRVKVIHKENGGLGFARNSGLDIATGNYVTFIDGDDYIGENHIKDMISLIGETGADTCIGGHTKKNNTNEIIHKNVCSGMVFKDNVKDEILPRMCGADFCGKDYIEMSVCMVMFSNDIIKKNNLRFKSEREYISEDLIFDFDYYPLSKVVCCSEITDYYYCDNSDSLTTKYNPKRFENQIKLYEYLSEKSKILNIDTKCIERLQNTTIAIARYSIKLECKFAHKNGKRNADLNIKNICNNPILEKILKEYDDSQINIKSKLINCLIRNKGYFLLKICMYIKNLFNI